MTYQQYTKLCEEILNTNPPAPPYDKPGYLNYTKLNYTRMKRWMQTLELNKNLVQVIKSINEPQQWIVIIEPWCGDVAHILPVLIKLANENSLITYDLQLRDSEPFLINNYLTNGRKSIPQFIVRDANGKDLFYWGSRPAGAQQLMDELITSKAELETIKIELQNWYNRDKGESLQKELEQLFVQKGKAKAGLKRV